MKILFTVTGSWGTGSFCAVEAIAKELLKKRHKAKILFPDPGIVSKDAYKYYSNNDLYDIWHFPIHCSTCCLKDFPLLLQGPHLRSLSALTFKQLSNKEIDFYFDEFSKALKEVIQDFKPDVIDSQHIWAMAYVLAKLNYPFIISAHNSDQLAFEYDKRMRPYALYAAKHASCICALTEIHRDRIAALYQIDKKKIFVVPNGYDHNIFKPLVVNRREVLADLGIYDIPDNAYIITFVGKVSHVKGVDILLKANYFLKNKNIYFLIFGSGNIEDVLDVSQKNQYSLDKVYFLGHQTAFKLAKAHNLANLYVMPSRSEGFSIACLEAMGCGLPVIYTPCDEIDKYAVGLKISHNNPKQLAAAILKMIAMPKQLYQQLSKKALQKAQLFSWDKITNEKIKIYKNCLSMSNDS